MHASSLDHFASPGPFRRDVAGLDYEQTKPALWSINIATASICLVAVCLCVGMKLYARSLTRSFGMDDWTGLLGGIFAVGYFVIALIMSKYGGGVHISDVSDDDVVSFLQSVYATMVVYGPCAFCIKASILLFVTRVFEPLKNIVRFINIFIIGMLCYYLPVMFIKAFICHPIQHFWDADVAGTCFDERSLILADAVLSVVSDIAILLIPLPMTNILQLPMKQKLRVAAMLGAGGVACICSVIRLVDIVQNGQSPDATYVFVRISLWGVAEVTIGIICATLPVFPMLLKRNGMGSIRETQPYGYGSRSDPIEMQRSKHERTTTPYQKPLPGHGSDENVLIVGQRHPSFIGKVETSIHGNELSASRRPSMEGQGIMKTVEIEQMMV